MAHNSTVCRKARSYQKTRREENHGITGHQTAVCNTNAKFQQFKHDIRANYCGGDITAPFGTQRRTPELYCRTHISQTRHFHGVSVNAKRNNMENVRNIFDSHQMTHNHKVMSL